MDEINTENVYDCEGVVKDNCPVCGHSFFSTPQARGAWENFFRSGHHFADKRLATLTCGYCGAAWNLHTGFLQERR